jgi:hypothetical protein
MTNKQVAEAFARGETKGKSLHMFIDGDAVYSYGYHFVIARRVSPFIVRFTDRGYSVTTQRHKSLVFHACRVAGLSIMTVSNP